MPDVPWNSLPATAGPPPGEHRCGWTLSPRGLRYSSEGGALVVRSRGSLARLVDSLSGLNHLERPLLWYPYVFTDPADAKCLGVRSVA
jgi:hypothetical protein